MVLLLAASISLLRSYLALAHADAGFDPANVLTFWRDLSDAVYMPQQQVDFFERVRTGVGRLPGVESTAFTALPPFDDLPYTIRLDVPGCDGVLPLVTNPRDLSALRICAVYYGNQPLLETRHDLLKNTLQVSMQLPPPAHTNLVAMPPGRSVPSTAVPP